MLQELTDFKLAACRYIIVAGRKYSDISFTQEKVMARTLSTMLELGTLAPDFNLNNIDGNSVSREQCMGKEGMLVLFICNHCPYVLHIIKALSELARQAREQGIGVVAISSNDVENYPADSPEKMAEFAQEHQFSFPYLYDEDQAVAKAYMAACTPDLFLFDKDAKLVYRGQFDASRPKNDEPVTGNDLRVAIDALLAGKQVSTEQVPSMGCNIKWKAGNEPDYYG